MENTKHDLIYISLGSNLGFHGLDSSQLLSKAILTINEEYSVIAVSSKYLSPAWPKGNDAPDFINMVIAIKGPRSPFALMKFLLKIEKSFGRIRNKENRNAPRTLDLDILDFHGKIINSIQGKIELVIPHARMGERDFVLLPLFEIAPDWKNPNNGEAISVLKQRFLEQNQHFTAKVCEDA